MIVYCRAGPRRPRGRRAARASLIGWRKAARNRARVAGREPDSTIPGRGSCVLLHDVTVVAYDEPAAAGLSMISRGLSLVLDDERVLEVSAAIFDGLYEDRRRLLLGERLG